MYAMGIVIFFVLGKQFRKLTIGMHLRARHLPLLAKLTTLETIDFEWVDSQVPLAELRDTLARLPALTDLDIMIDDDITWPAGEMLVLPSSIERLELPTNIRFTCPNLTALDIRYGESLETPQHDHDLLACTKLRHFSS